VNVGRYVAVVGPAEADGRCLALAEAAGAGLAEAGAVVLTGGLGGVMLAAARGAASRGGTVIGLLPGTDRSDANAYVTFALPTGLGQLRNGILVHASDALLGVGSSWGTVNEISLALRLGRTVAWLQGERQLQLEPAPVHVDDVETAVRVALDG
jgi:uncharacterized protein (TIGR00725 family)